MVKHFNLKYSLNISTHLANYKTLSMSAASFGWQTPLSEAISLTWCVDTQFVTIWLIDHWQSQFNVGLIPCWNKRPARDQIKTSIFQVCPFSSLAQQSNHEKGGLISAEGVFLEVEISWFGQCQHCRQAGAGACTGSWLAPEQGADWQPPDQPCTGSTAVNESCYTSVHCSYSNAGQSDRYYPFWRHF